MTLEAETSQSPSAVLRSGSECCGLGSAIATRSLYARLTDEHVRAEAERIDWIRGNR